jgi:beta-lactamase class A
LLAPQVFAAEADRTVGPGVLWNQKLQSKVMSIVKDFDGEVGVYVKDLDTGMSYSMNSDTYWYLASNVKLFILIEILRKIEKGEMNYTDPIQIHKFKNIIIVTEVDKPIGLNPANRSRYNT